MTNEWKRMYTREMMIICWWNCTGNMRKVVITVKVTGKVPRIRRRCRSSQIDSGWLYPDTSWYVKSLPPYSLKITALIHFVNSIFNVPERLRKVWKHESNELTSLQSYDMTISLQKVLIIFQSMGEWQNVRWSNWFTWKEDPSKKRGLREYYVIVYILTTYSPNCSLHLSQVWKVAGKWTDV